MLFHINVLFSIKRITVVVEEQQCVVCKTIKNTADPH